MLHLITGTPGAGKTLYAVNLILKQSDSNNTALSYNKTAHFSNKDLIIKNDLSHYFSTHTYFSKVTKQYETVIFEPDYFDCFLTSEVSDRIFLDVTFYNQIVKKIYEDTDIKLQSLRSYRHIYSNIDGLKVPNVRPLIVDWRQCPDGSIIFYDEVQLIFEFSTDNKQDKDRIVKDLTIHRHRAFDIYGITQFPSLVHPNFRAVVGLHYHLHRGWGAKAATVYVWANCRDKPNSLGNKLTAERDFRFNYPKRLYDFYESATADTVKLRVPLKLFAILLIPLVGILMLANLFTSDSPNFFSSIFGSGSSSEVVKNDSSSSNPSNSISSSDTPTSSNDDVDLSIFCRKGVNVEKPECKKWFDDLSNSNSSLQAETSSDSLSYDPNNPYSFSFIPKLEPTDFPRFSGVVRLKSNKLMALDQQGNYMPSISQQDCQRWLDGYRPFDYFKKPSSSNDGFHNKTSYTPVTFQAHQQDSLPSSEPVPLTTYIIPDSTVYNHSHTF